MGRRESREPLFISTSLFQLRSYCYVQVEANEAEADHPELGLQHVGKGSLAVYMRPESIS